MVYVVVALVVVVFAMMFKVWRPDLILARAMCLSGKLGVLRHHVATGRVDADTARRAEALYRAG